MELHRELMSIKKVMSSLIRLLGINNFDSNYTEDFLVWIEDAMELVECYPLLVDIHKPIKIKDYLGELPCHFRMITGVSHKGERLRKSSDITFLDVDKYNTNVYAINGSQIKINIKETELTFYYKDFKRDEEGFILIQNIAALKQYLVFYCLEQASIAGYKGIKLSLADIERRKDMYEMQAIGKIKLPSLEDLERTRQSNFSLLQDFYNYAKFGAGDEQVKEIRTHFNFFDNEL